MSMAIFVAGMITGAIFIMVVSVAMMSGRADDAIREELEEIQKELRDQKDDGK